MALSEPWLWHVAVAVMTLSLWHENNLCGGVQVAYMAKRQSDMPAAQVTPLPCAGTFPGAPGAGATTIPSATISVSQPLLLHCYPCLPALVQRVG